MNSATDTTRCKSSSQHQRERQTNVIKQSQKNRWQADLASLFKKVVPLLPKFNWIYLKHTYFFKERQGNNNKKNYIDTASIGNGPVQKVGVGESTRHTWVNQSDVLKMRERERLYSKNTSDVNTDDSLLRRHAYSNILKTLTPKNENFQIKKIWYFSYFCSKHRFWVLVRTASARRF